MPPVFAHGRLRLYLLKLLEEAPRHGYEVIRLLEERFQGLYAPSAGTVYPRLAKLEAEGLVRHATEGGRKVYSLTDPGRAELAARRGELAELELEIRDSLAALAADIRADVSGSASALRHEMWAQAHSAPDAAKAGGRQARQARRAREAGETREAKDARDAKEELRRANQEWKEQARRAEEDARRARYQAEQERAAHAEAVQHLNRITEEVRERVRGQADAGDWQGVVQSGFFELARHMGDLGRITEHTTAWPPYVKPDPAAGSASGSAEPGGAESDGSGPEDGEPESGDPVRDLERMLDRFRDEVRDAARDSGVTEAQLRAARRQLSAAAAHIVAALRGPAS